MRKPLTIGSLCTGYGGLDMAITDVLGGELVWVADNHPGAAAILAHRHPDVPNLGDITSLDWAKVRRADIVCAGFPCTDISDAGRGEGILEGNRSGLWFTIARALRTLRPRLVVLENVGRIVTRRPGLDVVLADLAALGFDAEWTCVRASDVGAPHERERWFLLAWPADSDGPGLEGQGLRGTTSQRALTPTDAADLGHQRGRPARRRRPGPEDRHHAPADPHGRGLTGNPQRDIAEKTGIEAPRRRDAAGRVLDWGRYRPAIERWEQILGRPVPAPTIVGTRGQPKLNPVFDEWMMGLPEGHVTDVPGLTDNQMIHACGNGVVPRQAVHGLRILLDRATWRAAS